MSSVGRRRAVLLGGAHSTLALARSLRRAGLDVWLVTDETSCACFSNAIAKVVRWRGATHPDAVAELEDIARENMLAGSILVPSADPDVRLVALAHERLSSLFVVMTAPWEQLRWACDKALTYLRAQELGVGVPRVYERALLADSGCGQLQYPLVLKPSMRLYRNRFTLDRAWRVNDRDGFKQRYQAACELVGADQVIAQQLIPGDGNSQVSYAGLWNRGQPLMSLTARRLRQYPVEFGSTSTYVETAHLPDVAAAAETFLHSIHHHGLVEMEFKRDQRDGMLKLLDVNPRPWNWLGLAGPAGIDFGAAISAMASNRPVPDATARAGVGWIFVSRDIVAAATSGRLRPQALPGYVATWARVRSFACCGWKGPVPGIIDFPLTVARVLQRRKAARAGAEADERPLPGR